MRRLPGESRVTAKNHAGQKQDPEGVDLIVPSDSVAPAQFEWGPYAEGLAVLKPAER